MKENVVQIRDYQRKGTHGYAMRVNAKADRAFWFGPPVLVDDLTMGRADPEIEFHDSGDCA